MIDNGYEKDLENSKVLQDFKESKVRITSNGIEFKVKEAVNLLSALQNEQQMLLEKMRESMNDGNVGTYKNLVLALKEITYLVQKEEEKIKNGDMYIDFGRDVSYIYFNGLSYAVKGNKIIEDVVNKVKWITDNDRETKIFIDFTNSSSGVYDILKYQEGFKNIKCLLVNN